MNKPVCKLTGTDGNAFAVVGKAVRTLKEAGMKDKADELNKTYMNCKSYDELLCLVMDYVEVV